MARTSNLIARFDDTDVKRLQSSTLRTTHALLFHAAGNQLRLITAHPVHETQRAGQEIGPGRPLSPEDEAVLVDLLLSARGQLGFEIIPPTLLYRDGGTMLWWAPPAVRPMHLRRDGKLTTIRTLWPNLVLMVRARTLFVAALAGSERPTATTKLYHAPLANIFSDGSMCTGDVKLPVEETLADIPAWEAALFGSAFTHANHADAIGRAPAAKSAKKSKSKPSEAAARSTDPEAFWSARNGSVAPFPDQRLVAMRLTLREWPGAVGDRRRRGAH